MATDETATNKARDAALVIAGNWSAIMAQHSSADLRPIRVRGEARERRRAG